MTNSIIGYDNGLETGTVSASSDPAATPKENAFDWRLDDYWQPAAATENYLEVDFGSAQSIDYVAFYSSDFYTMTGANIELESGASSPPSTSRVNENITTRGPKVFTFTSASARYWRFTLNTTGSESPKIQLVAFGQRLELEGALRPGFRPPALANRFREVQSVSAGGFPLGRSLKVAPVSFELELDVLTASWIRSNWPNLLDHMASKPFFLLPEPDNYSDEAVLAWSRGMINAPRYSTPLHMGLTLNLEAFV